MTKSAQALSIYAFARRGADRLEDEDLVIAARHHPDMLPALEEVQHLRREVDALQRVVATAKD